mmetsp:Transcript_104931/g.306477  ORF Transcript_104931/g.306477 Transcript_104931/m.306477 type:complete len:294 (+) Transcript_104931:46-927(+)
MRGARPLTPHSQLQCPRSPSPEAAPASRSQRLLCRARDGLGLLGAGVRLALLLFLLHVVASALPPVVHGRIAHALSLMAWVLGLEVLDASQLEMLPVGDELLHLAHGRLGHPPPVQLLLECRHVQVPEGTAVHLACRLVWKAYDLGAAKAVLALQMSFLAVSMLYVVAVVLVEGGGINLGVFRQLLLPPLEGLINREAAFLQERTQLQPTRVLQVLLILALLLHNAPHARREGARQVLLEIVQRKLVARISRRGLWSHEQLHAILLQVSQETTNSGVGECHRQPLERDVHQRI